MRGAEITERVLFDCLSRLPPNYADRNPEHPYPVTTMYNRAIIAWGNLRTQEAAQRAEKIFQLMMSEYNQEADWVRQQNKKQQAMAAGITDRILICSSVIIVVLQEFLGYIRDPRPARA
jgi:hypothetical protein